MRTLAGPRLEFPVPRVLQADPGRVCQDPKVLEYLGTWRSFDKVMIAMGSLSGKMHKREFCPQIQGAQGLQMTRSPILNKVFLHQPCDLLLEPPFLKSFRIASSPPPGSAPKEWGVGSQERSTV